MKLKVEFGMLLDIIILKSLLPIEVIQKSEKALGALFKIFWTKKL